MIEFFPALFRSFSALFTAEPMEYILSIIVLAVVLGLFRVSR